MSGGRGAGAGALVGGIIGILGGPAGVALGAGIGAAAGGAIASRDKGFRDESLSTIGTALKPGTSAVAMITSHDFLVAVQQHVDIEAIRYDRRRIWPTNYRHDSPRRRTWLSGCLLTEAGLAIQEIAANEETAEVVGAVLTDDAIAVGVLVATADGVAYQVAGAIGDVAVMETGVITDDGQEA